MIDIENLTYRIGNKILFEDASSILGKGQKIGLVGLNGSGKTTLFKIILGQLPLDGGRIRINPNLKIVAQEQEIDDTEISLLDFVLSKDKEIIALNKRLEQEKDPLLMSEIYEQLNVLGANSAKARAGSILSGLGFSFEDQQRKLKEFSGGWRVRASLAGTLFQRADLLLLDEPTNHLDLETSIWFTNFIKKVNTTVIIISHDKNILNEICNNIVSIEERKLVSYGGNYDSFIKNKAIKLEMLKSEAEKHERQRKHLQSFVDRFRYKATKAKQAQSRLKMLEKLGDAPTLPKETWIKFNFPSPENLPPPLLTISKVNAGYGDKVILRNLNLRLDQDDRIAIIGANGNGKSTLAKLLYGAIPPLSGEIDKSNKLKIAYFAQHQIEFLNTDKTPYAILNELMPKEKETNIMNHLGRFGLGSEKANTLVKNLSGGEKARLQLSIITKDAPHILILDEPTNHLDIDSREALTEALNDYEGAVIIITHDLSMIELVSDRLWLVEGGSCQVFQGSIDDYKKHIIENVEENEKKEKPKKNIQEKPKSVPKNTIAQIEKQLAELEDKKVKLENMLALEYSDITEKEYSSVTSKINELEEKWLTLNGV